MVTTSEFQQIKTQLALLEDRGSLAKNQQDRAPSLRRKTPSGGRPSADDDRDSDRNAKPEDKEPTEDDRPTLKRKN